MSLNPPEPLVKPNKHIYTQRPGKQWQFYGIQKEWVLGWRWHGGYSQDPKDETLQKLNLLCRSRMLGGEVTSIAIPTADLQGCPELALMKQLNPQNSPLKEELLLPPHYRWRRGGTDRLSTCFTAHALNHQSELPPLKTRYVPRNLENATGLFLTFLDQGELQGNLVYSYLRWQEGSSWCLCWGDRTQ